MNDVLFARQCLERFTMDILRGKLGLSWEVLSSEARQRGLSADVIWAIALIEHYRRPSIARIVEDFLAYCNLGLYLLAGIPVRNVSLGLFQVKIATAAKVMNIRTVSANGNWLVVTAPKARLGRARTLLRLIRAVTKDASNARIGAEYVGLIYQEWAKRSSTGSEPCDFVTFLGRTYNGSEHHMAEGTFVPYDVVLRNVVHGLRAETGPAGK